MSGIVNQPALVDLPRPQRSLAPVSDIVRYLLTHTADTALATRASGGSKIGATITGVKIPAVGVIRVTLLEAEFDETENTSDAQVAIALDVGGTKVWAASDSEAGTSLDKVILISQNVSSRLIKHGLDSDVIKPINALIMIFDITANSFTSGNNTIEIYMGDNAGGVLGEATLTGTTVTCRILIEVITALAV